MYSTPEVYRRKHGSRVTWVETDDGEQRVDVLYADLADGSVQYPVFRTRLTSLAKRRTEISQSALRDAALLSSADWKTFYGGGRRSGFSYSGTEYPNAQGDYSGFTAFLKSIGRYADKGLLNSRRKAQWDTDDLLREPPTESNEPGYIYAIIEKATGKTYVGLTVNKPQIRFRQHLNYAETGSKTPFHKALRKKGGAAFRLQVLEEISLESAGRSADGLDQREIFWIEKLNSLHPQGYNVRPGGQIGRYDGKRVNWQGREFRSIEKMARVLSDETGLATHVIINRYRNNEPLPETARAQSNHPDAGGELWRQWKGILKRAGESGVEEAWLDYNQFKSDIGTIDQSGLMLTRSDESRPWGPDNWTLMSSKQVVRRTHGKKFAAFGKTWTTKQAALDAHGVRRNVFDYRIKSGMSVEEALTAPLGPTSAKPFKFEGEVFRSRNSACEELAKRYGMTTHQVKDRLVREIPLADWPISS
ncbi:GIY-YIG nuclease family protein [Henriciella sp.]|uniref:GIY-YIG nuclease family protein n=1 Tax=Henriciella sp. TaxID=1968823 RepID=UPI0026342811|nr:GIY-YIG nuclease family protein [Henriciella sp.]